MCEKNYIWNPARCSCENGKYLGDIIDDSVIISYEIIDTTKTVPRKTVPTKSTSINFYILLNFLLITIALLIAVSFYCCFMKYRSKQKHLLPYRVTNNKSEKFYIDNII